METLSNTLNPHLKFTEQDFNLMKSALDMARSAKEHGEVAVGCVFYHIPSDAIIISSGNLTNASNNVITLIQPGNCSLRDQLH
jgi:hypothetical protein